MSAASGVVWLLLWFFVFVSQFRFCTAQIVGGTISSEIQKRGELQTYGKWLTDTGRYQLFDDQKRFTVFAPNNTAFKMLPKNRYDAITKTLRSTQDYIDAYAIADSVLTTSSLYNKKQQKSFHNTPINFAQPPDRAGIKEYFVNGAHIVKRDIACSNGVLHIVGQVTDTPSTVSVWGYLLQPDLDFLKIDTFSNMLSKYSSDPNSKSIADIRSQAGKITMFVPTNEALARIPSEKRDQLINTIPPDRFLHKSYIKDDIVYPSWVRHKDTFRSGNPQEENIACQFFSFLHKSYIKDDIVYTSWVRHKDTFRSGNPHIEENIAFRKLMRDGVAKVYVHSGGVSAEIVHGNITVNNGVIHIVDRMLGYLYYTAREEIRDSSNFASTIFDGYVSRAPADILATLNKQDASEVTVFVPTDKAFQEVIDYAPWFDLTQQRKQLIVLQLHIVRRTANVLLENVEFENRATFPTLYYSEILSVYARYDLSFVEGGYVRSRVIGPDIGVTNGLIQYIDRVLGVPTRDIPAMLCEDNWLRKPYEAIKETGLISVMTDCRLVTKPQKCTSIYSLDLENEELLGYGYVYKPNDVKPCDTSSTVDDYTFFAPNGTALMSFLRDRRNRVIWEDKALYKRVLSHHIIPGRIYLNQLSEGKHQYKNLNGESIYVIKTHGRVYTYEINYRGRSASILQADIGATNGVLHIVNMLLFTDDDTTSSAYHRSTGLILFMLLVCLVKSYLFT